MKPSTRLPLPPSPDPARSVLLVDPQEMILTVVSSLLRSWGFRARVATHLIQACRMVVSEGPFDAVICNYELPDGNAFDLVAWMRSQQLTVPAIVPFGSEPPQVTLLENVKLLAKPFDPTELHKILDAAGSPAPQLRRQPAVRRSPAVAVGR